MSKSRLSRSNQPLESNDPLYDFILKCKAFYKKYSKFVWLVIVGLLVLAFLLTLSLIRADQNEEQAADEYYKLLPLMQGQANPDEIDESFKRIINTWPRTLAAAKSALQLANIQYGLNNLEDAKNNFTLVANYDSGSYLHPTGLLGLGNCHEQQADFARALEYYEMVLNLKRDFGFKDRAFLSKVRVLGAQGDLDQALLLLDQFLAQNPHAGREALSLLAWLESTKAQFSLPAGE